MRRLLSAALCVGAVAVSLGIVAAVAMPILSRTAPDGTAFGGTASDGSASHGSVTNPPSEVPMITDGSASTLADPPGLSGSWALSAESWAGYSVGADLGGDSVTLSGVTSQVSGSMTLDNGTITAAEVTVDVDPVTTGNSVTDSLLHNTAAQNAAHTAEFPTATFSLVSPAVAALPATDSATPSPSTESPSTPLPSAGPATIHATGNLTMHGVSHSISVDLQVSHSATSVTVQGSIPITFADYDVTAPDLGFASVNDSGSITFSLVTTRQ
ncbi:YceI family protein [Subtercola sp. PAMC28395]|uniref:YceI family protein n=1 Tax=Subtercola sp. PAMC28395 TaxID=2846775 RepID=UPI001C0B4B3B|nr:YceI family protein [Subtercola sp. PAMC28395]QWT23618.1 YceI family protein [Subtercola sp. PAMC28395]